ncbi:enoyl-CoA hydratase/isomerase family protein [Devosia ginsengisoli]|uniref:Enoyl-CoA hydratase/isomerase family protein n=1 Tax=Devosia ginsengisoli TaxID=400770 RepID=A0A5B8LQA6_9HYPH|nr:enoyl-CoA hydratase/isomerase family protein [Devosia ginsengisoli]QDZ10226.1 enoyl-CoA hydratase/isomerase family protein [Devosia ginsengisoli]
MPIDVDVDAAGVATITINRPERRNALDAEHYHDLGQAFCRVRDEAAIRCAIVTGAGDVFCAGADLKTWIGRDPSLAELWATQAGQLLNRGLEVWKPVIAAINGACIGGGMTLLFATDIRVAARNAFFSLPEGQRGIIPANGGTQRALHQLPHAVAMKLLLTGERMSAEEAGRWGLVNDVVDAGDVMSTARRYAASIAASAPLSIQATKELALRSRDVPLAEGLRMEQLTQRILLASKDAAEGRQAFAERRSPRFEGH